MAWSARYGSALVSQANNHGTIFRMKKEKVALTLRLAEPGDAHAIAEMSRDYIESGLGWRYDPAHVLRAMRRRESAVLVACGRQTYVARERFRAELAAGERGEQGRRRARFPDRHFCPRTGGCQESGRGPGARSMRIMRIAASRPL